MLFWMVVIKIKQQISVSKDFLLKFSSKSIKLKFLNQTENIFESHYPLDTSPAEPDRFQCNFM